MATLYVIDASALLAAWLPDEAYQVEADRLLEQYVNGHVELCAPSLILHEILNGIFIATRGKGGQKHRISLENGMEVCAMFRGLNLRIDDTLALSDKILETATRYQLASAYDATYLALAEQLRCELVTADRRLLKSVGKKLKWVRPLWDWERGNTKK